MAKRIKINGTEFTNMLAPYGYRVSYSTVYGNNGGVMLDGSTMDDILALKATVTIPVLPLSDADISTLLEAVYQYPYPTLYYFDPKAKGYRSAAFRRDKAEQKYRGFGSDGKEYWTGLVLTLVEK